MFPLWKSSNTHTHTQSYTLVVQVNVCIEGVTSWKQPEKVQDKIYSLSHTHTLTQCWLVNGNFEFEMEKCFLWPFPAFHGLASLHLPLPFAPFALFVFFHLLSFCYLVFAVFISPLYLHFTPSDLFVFSFLSLTCFYSPTHHKYQGIAFLVLILNTLTNR